MHIQNILKILVSILVPVVTAVAGAITFAFQDWWVQRSKTGRRKLAVEEARAQVNFVADWWNAAKSLEQSPEALQEAAKRATALLEEASTVISAVGLMSPVPEPPLTLRPSSLCCTRSRAWRARWLEWRSSSVSERP
jgi:hypothetical protein